MGSKDKRFPLICCFVFLAVLIVSAIHPKDYFTWFLEVVPAIIALPLLVFTYRNFRLTDLAYGLILLHGIILMVGGHYTYAEVPPGEWAKEWFGMERNNYDKVGHFAQGFIPAIIIREIFIRKGVVSTRGWRNFIIVCVCLAISAVYEFIEWFVAAASGQEAEAFLGTQGYVWDTQSDMLCATIGAIIALTALAQWHNAQLKRFILN
jgi:putative membrane protein